MYDVHRQFPEPSDNIVATSPAAVVMLPPPGRINDVPLCVSVSTPAKTRTRSIPADSVPSAVIVVVPVTVTNRSLTLARSVVAALAMLVLAHCWRTTFWISRRLSSRLFEIEVEPAGLLLAAVVLHCVRVASTSAAMSCPYRNALRRPYAPAAAPRPAAHGFTYGVGLVVVPPRTACE